MDTTTMLTCLFGFVFGQLLICIGLAVCGWWERQRKEDGDDDLDGGQGGAPACP